MRTYLRNYTRLPSSPMHAELCAMVEQASLARGARIAVAAPRGHAKSTIVATALPLWQLCYGREQFIVILSATIDLARSHLDSIRREIEGNQLLRRDFPEICGTVRPWSKDDILTPNGVRLVALGSESQIRGRRHREARPTLIIADDFESDLGVRSAELRDRCAAWFNSAVAKAGTGDTNIIVVGTLLHPSSFLSTLIDPHRSPGWEGRRYRAVLSFADRADLWATWEAVFNRQEEFEGQHGPEAASTFYHRHEADMLIGTNVLWPERESYHDLMVLRVREGMRAFMAEKQNEPTNPETSIFAENVIRYWDDRFPEEASLLAHLDNTGGHMMFGACDPSLGKPGRGRDFTAIVTIARDLETGVLYVLDAFIAKLAPDRIVESIIDFSHRRNYAAFGIETVQFQQVLADEVQRKSRERGCEIPVRSITHDTDKLSRLQSIQPLVASGCIQFSRRHTLLIEQLLQAPDGAHDDGPDAVEMAVRTAQSYRHQSRIWYM